MANGLHLLLGALYSSEVAITALSKIYLTMWCALFFICALFSTVSSQVFSPVVDEISANVESSEVESESHESILRQRRDAGDLEVILNPGPILSPDIVIGHFVDSSVNIHDTILEELGGISTSTTHNPNATTGPPIEHSFLWPQKIVVDKKIGSSESEDDEDDDDQESMMLESQLYKLKHFTSNESSVEINGSGDIGDIPPRESRREHCFRKINATSGSFMMNFSQDCTILITSPDKMSRLILHCGNIKLGNCSTHRDSLTVNVKGDLRFGRNSYLYCGPNSQIRTTSLRRKLSIRLRRDFSLENETECKFFARKQRFLEVGPTTDGIPLCGRLGRSSKEFIYSAPSSVLHPNSLLNAQVALVQRKPTKPNLEGRRTTGSFCSIRYRNENFCFTLMQFGANALAPKSVEDSTGWAIGRRGQHKVMHYPVEPNNREFHFEIVGGKRVSPGLFPWMAQLDITRTDGSQTTCTGSLLSNMFVLTAAHCLKNSESISIFLGGTDRLEFTGSEVTVQAEKYILNRNWNPRTLVADMALVKLSDPVRFTEEVSPVCLPTRKMRRENMNGRKGVAAGWGRLETSESAPRQLYRVKLPFLNDGLCFLAYRRFFRRNLMMCTESTEEAAICYGDSGGPLMYKRKELVYQLGIASYSSSKVCGESYDVFTKLGDDYVAWINTKIRSESG